MESRLALHFPLHSIFLLQSGEPRGIISPPAFTPHPLPHAEGTWWITATLFLSFTILVILRVFDHRRLVQLLNGFVRASSVSVLYREEYSLTSRVSVLLLANYLLVLPLFIWQVAGYYGAPHNGLAGFAAIAVGISIAYLVKITSTRVLGSIFELREAASEYIYNVLLFNKTAGLILFPVCLLLAFARQIPPEILIWTGIVLWCMILIYRLLRVVLIGISTTSVSFLYIILYLCTLEIIPFVVILKVFVGTFHTFHP